MQAARFPRSHHRPGELSFWRGFRTRFWCQVYGVEAQRKLYNDVHTKTGSTAIFRQVMKWEWFARLLIYNLITMVSNFYKDRTFLFKLSGHWSFLSPTLLSFKIQISCPLRISESSKADCCKWQQQQQKACSVFKSTLTHLPNWFLCWWLPENISWRVNLIDFLVVEECLEKAVPALMWGP